MRTKADYSKFRTARGMGTVSATRGFRARYGTGANEKKVSDIQTAPYGVSIAGGMTLLHLPVLGSDYNQRIGRKTLVKSIYIRGRVAITNFIIQPPGVSTIIPTGQARLIVFIDKQPNGAVPLIGDLLNTAEPGSQLNLNNRDRFQIITDKIYSFDASLTNGTSYAFFNQTQYNIKIYKKVSIETIFNGTNGGTIADINSGAIYMCWVGNANTQGGGQTAIVSTRCRYVDD